MTKVLFIDPGERVGWATGLASPELIEYTDSGISPLKTFALALGEKIGDYDVVGYETFALTPKGAKVSIGSEMATSQLIGMIRYLCWMTPSVKIVSQSPILKNTADKVATGDFADIIAREPGTHDDAHNVDAVRHLYVWWWKKYVEGVINAK